MRTPILLAAALFTATLLAQDPLRIWGLTPAGGANDRGTVFSVNTDGSDFTTVFDFSDASGWGPEGGLCLAPNGLLYGLTTFGGEGAPAAGTLFTIDPANGNFTKLRDFSISNGGYNWSSLIVGTDGMLYGAGYAGSDGGGSIYRVDPTNNEYTELYALDQATDGGAITGVLIQATDGKLYGGASQGGVTGEAGTLFSYDPITDEFTKLHDFDGAAGGRTPYGGLCQAGNGWLYGTTYEGGLNKGCRVFKSVLVTEVFETIHDIADDNGLNCWATMLRLAPDLLIGGVASGGLNSGGFLYTVVPSTDEVAVVTNFSLATGASPIGALTSAPDGALYGLNAYGGTAFFGTLYNLDPLTYQPTILHHFTSEADGGQPRGEPLVISGAVGMNEATQRPFFSVSPNPCSGETTLRCDAALLPMQARISDALGRTIGTLRISDSSTALDLGTTPGMRSITLMNSTKTHTERVMVR